MFFASRQSLLTSGLRHHHHAKVNYINAHPQLLFIVQCLYLIARSAMLCYMCWLLARVNAICAEIILLWEFMVGFFFLCPLLFIHIFAHARCYCESAKAYTTHTTCSSMKFGWKCHQSITGRLIRSEYRCESYAQCSHPLCVGDDWGLL